MATIVWPSTLPEYVLIANYKETAPKTAVAQSMDIGPAKRRRRGSASRKFVVRLALEEAQVEILDNFFLNTLAGGALPFDWVHPRTRSSATMAFTDCKPPEYRQPDTGGEKWYADMEVEILP